MFRLCSMWIHSILPDFRYVFLITILMLFSIYIVLEDFTANSIKSEIPGSRTANCWGRMMDSRKFFGVVTTRLSWINITLAFLQAAFGSGEISGFTFMWLCIHVFILHRTRLFKLFGSVILLFLVNHDYLVLFWPAGYPRFYCEMISLVIYFIFVWRVMIFSRYIKYRTWIHDTDFPGWTEFLEDARRPEVSRYDHPIYDWHRGMFNMFALRYRYWHPKRLEELKDSSWYRPIDLMDSHPIKKHYWNYLVLPSELQIHSYKYMLFVVVAALLPFLIICIDSIGWVYNPLEADLPARFKEYEPVKLTLTTMPRGVLFWPYTIAILKTLIPRIVFIVVGMWAITMGWQMSVQCSYAAVFLFLLPIMINMPFYHEFFALRPTVALGDITLFYFIGVIVYHGTLNIVERYRRTDATTTEWEVVFPAFAMLMFTFLVYSYMAKTVYFGFLKTFANFVCKIYTICADFFSDHIWVYLYGYVLNPTLGELVRFIIWLFS